MSQLEVLQLEKLVYGGACLGRLKTGEVIFVEQGVPGDQVELAYAPTGKKPLKGSITQLIQPASARVSPVCSVFEQCGGCDWQQMELAAQRDWKQRIVAESLTRLGRLQELQVDPTWGLDGYYYRNKAVWHVQVIQNQVKLGYHSAQSHHVVAFETCWIIPPEWNELKRCLETHLKSEDGVREVLVRQNSLGQILLAFKGELTSQSRLEALVEPLTTQFKMLVGIVLQPKNQPEYTLWGQGILIETLGERQYVLSADSFFQVNLAVMMQMLRQIEAWLPSSIHTLLDLYAGVGTFSVWFHQQAQRVIAIEQFAPACVNAQQTIQLNQAQNIDLLEGDVAACLSKLDEYVQVTLLDPPRAGCSEVVLDWIAAHTQQQIIYVSCNPTTLARDLKQLTSQGWKVKAIQPLDMFPQTYHVETLVCLQRAE